MYRKYYTKQFEKSLRKVLHSGKVTRAEVEDAITLIAEGERLAPAYQDHGLQGEFAGYRECHIRGNLLLIYKIENDLLVLVLANIGTHPELFG